jgi:sugar O-acyltransferase (sialic acid O-acetyltransferase NeuD family)
MKTSLNGNVVVIGGVGTALNIIEQIIDSRNNHSLDFQLKGIVIDSFEKGSLISGTPVIGNTQDIKHFLKDETIRFIFALFKPDKMQERYHLMESLNIPMERFISFIHPLSYVSSTAVIGTGNVIMSNSTVQSNVSLGNFNIINSNVTIEHDSFIGSGNFLAAGTTIGSDVRIGNHCFFGLNSSVREHVVLGNNVFTGMHSAVLSNFDNVRIAGVPARVLKSK